MTYFEQQQRALVDALRALTDLVAYTAPSDKAGDAFAVALEQLDTLEKIVRSRD